LNVKQVAKEQVQPEASQYVLTNGKVKMVIDHDMQTHVSEKVTFSSVNQGVGFHEESIEEKLTYYNGDNTHSCIYLFNPKSKMEVETKLTLVNVTKRETSTFT
jgi:hypothetical protein